MPTKARVVELLTLELQHPWLIGWSWLVAAAVPEDGLAAPEHLAV
jgi:hypothetical protein